MLISFSVSDIDYFQNKMIYSQGEHALKYILEFFLNAKSKGPDSLDYCLIFWFLLCHPILQ